jgi:hypothetical protein
MPSIGIADKATLDLIKAAVDLIASYTDALEGDATTLKTNVGSNADASSSAGSVHAKIKELRATLLAKNIINYGSAIKSIQRGTIALSTSQTSNTATITAVTTTKAVALLLGVTGSSAQVSGEWSGLAEGHLFARVSLTNATTVTANRGIHYSSTLTVGYVVVEFY